MMSLIERVTTRYPLATMVYVVGVLVLVAQFRL